jgi:hypothetical protein
MKLRFRITPVEGDPYEVTTTLAITVAWERKYKRRTTQAATEGLATEELLFMAYEAAKRSGITVPITLDAFIDRIDEYEVEPVEAGPTDPASTEGN